jgi:hypothetical protein
MQKLNPLFEFNVYVDVNMMQNNLVISALGDRMSNLERLAVWKIKHSTGRPRRTDEVVDQVRQAVMQSMKKSVSQLQSYTSHK